MTLVTSRLRELKNQPFSARRSTEQCCELAKQLEEKGEYEAARKVLSAQWRGIGERPKLAGLEPSTAAEVLLRAGTLTGAPAKSTRPATFSRKRFLISLSIVN